MNAEDLAGDDGSDGKSVENVDWDRKGIEEEVSGRMPVAGAIPEA